MWKRRSLARRMAATVAFSALASGTLVALVTGLLSDRLAQSQEDGRLRDAAITLAYELQTKQSDPESVTIDENEELSHTGITVAIYADTRHVAGDRKIPYVEAAQCQDRGANRVCSVQAGHWVVSAARDRRL